MNRRVLPGFGVSLGFSLTYLGVLIVVPLAACVAKACELTPERFFASVWSPRARSAYGLTFGASLSAAVISAMLGLLLAWVLARHAFPLKRLVDALVDLPFALPTAVAGLVYSSLYVDQGWLGQVLVPMGIKVAYTRLGIVLVLVFIGMPFVVRAIQPVLEGLDGELEEAAALLGASSWQTFLRVIMPAISPALVTGFALAFARSIGEYGAVVFLSGNMPMRTEIAPVLIVSRLEEFAYGEATAVALVLLAASFGTLALINTLERWSNRHHA